MKPYVKRLPTQVSYRDDVLLFGLDNLYPQRIEAVVDRSPVTKSAIKITSDFINGLGFTSNGDFSFGEYTADELLAFVADDFSLFESCAFIFDISMNGTAVDIQPIDFKYVRLGVPKKGTNEITYAKVSVDWEEQLPKAMRMKPITYPLWPGSPEEALEIVNTWDFESWGEFNGFMLYKTPRKTTYPLSTVDSVIDSSQTNGEIQLFELAGVQNGFLGATLLKHQGKIESREERQRLENVVSSIRGAENANSVVLWEVPDGYDKEVLEQFPANNQDRLFENTNRTTVNRIVQSLGIPPPLLGIMPETSFFTKNEIEDSYKYFNVRTNNRRIKLSRIFEELASIYVQPVQLGLIKPQSFTYLGEELPQTPVPLQTATPDANTIKI